MTTTQPPMGRINVPLAFLGGGNMTGAIIAGATRNDALGGGCVVADRNTERLDTFDVGARTAAEALTWLAEEERSKGFGPGSGQIVLAVKPQSLGQMAAEIREIMAEQPERVVISILAGTPSARVHELLGGRGRVVRVMPNTPSRVGVGCTAIAAGAGAVDADLVVAETLFRAIGTVERIHEYEMDAWTGVAGSGPAYLFYLAEAMIGAGVQAGLSDAVARRAVRQTLLGAATLLHSSDETAETLRQRVTSKGGTTAAATAVLDQAGFADAVVRAIAAAKARGEELSASSSV